MLNFSIITATFNNYSLLKTTIQSVQSQESVIVEHIIVDAASTDGTQEFLASLQNQENLTYVIKSETDHGIYDGINKGLGLANNDIVGIIHSDDFFSDQNVLHDVMKAFSYGADIVYGDLEYVDRFNEKSIVRRWIAGDFFYSQLRFGWMPPHPTFFIKRSLIKEIKYDTRYSIAADYDFMLKIILQPNLKIQYIPRVMVKMRTGGVSNESFKNILRKSYEDYKIAKKFFKLPSLTVLIKNLRKLKQFMP